MVDTQCVHHATPEQIATQALSDIQQMIDGGLQTEGREALHALAEQLTNHPDLQYKIATMFQKMSLWDDALAQYNQIAKPGASHVIFANMVYVRLNKANQILDQLQQSTNAN